MRVLASTTAGAGHLGPMLPFARALRDAGHEVTFAAPASFATTIERAGFDHAPFADGAPDRIGAVFAGLQGKSNDEGNEIVLAEVFGRLDAQAGLPALRTFAGEWGPDLVLRETAEFASYAVAEDLGIPHVQVATGVAGFELRHFHVLEEPLAELGVAAGVGGLLASPRLSLVPLSFEDPAAPGYETTRRFRAEDAATPTPTPLPDWWADATGPLVYVTFGSVAARIGLFPGLYRQVVDTLAGSAVRVLMTTGEAGDPQRLGPLPANVHVERWWPQDDVMPHAAALVGHGGFGTTLAGLVAGVPQVVVPLFADQPYNARRVAAVGAGIALDGVADLAGAVDRVLHSDSHRAAAAAVAAEIAGLPPASDCVPYLESRAGRG